MDGDTIELFRVLKPEEVAQISRESREEFLRNLQDHDGHTDTVSPAAQARWWKYA